MPEDDDLGSTSGLPEELGVDGGLRRSEQRLTIRTDARRYGTPVAVVSRFDTDVTDVEDVASELKRAIACGGTVDDDEIELQGDHADRPRDLLGEGGYAVEQ